METVTVLLFLGFKITVDIGCSHSETKRCLLFGRKLVTNLDSVLKSRDITLLKSMFSQSYTFFSSQVWM